MYLTLLRVQMKSYKRLLSEKNEKPIVEGISASKLKRLNLVSDDDFSVFVRVMKKMDGEKPITIKEKDIIVTVFNELVNAIISDQALMQKIAKRNDKE